MIICRTKSFKNMSKDIRTKISKSNLKASTQRQRCQRIRDVRIEDLGRTDLILREVW